jgi:hypothetical protein
LIPKLLLRILLIGYLYGITSERKLVEELPMHWRGAGFPAWSSIRRSRITPHSRRIGTGAFRSRTLRAVVIGFGALGKAYRTVVGQTKKLHQKRCALDRYPIRTVNFVILTVTEFR